MTILINPLLVTSTVSISTYQISARFKSYFFPAACFLASGSKYTLNIMNYSTFFAKGRRWDSNQ